VKSPKIGHREQLLQIRRIPSWHLPVDLHRWVPGASRSAAGQPGTAHTRTYGVRLMSEMTCSRCRRRSEGLLSWPHTWHACWRTQSRRSPRTAAGAAGTLGAGAGAGQRAEATWEAPRGQPGQSPALAGGCCSRRGCRLSAGLPPDGAQLHARGTSRPALHQCTPHGRAPAQAILAMIMFAMQTKSGHALLAYVDISAGRHTPRPAPTRLAKSLGAQQRDRPHRDRSPRGDCLPTSCRRGDGTCTGSRAAGQL
jgi:hypothetical protein